MAVWSAISTGEKDANSPITESLISKLDQNPQAIAQGASGAPKVQTAGIQAAAVSQSVLKTTTLEVFRATSGSVVLTSGQYGFFPQIRNAADSGTYDVRYEMGRYNNSGDENAATNVTKMYINVVATNSAADPYFVVQRYVQASPPYELGGVDMPLFVYLLVDDLGNIIAGSAAEDAPWSYNGPSDIRPDLIEYDETTKKTKKYFLRKQLTPELRALRKSDPEAFAEEFKLLTPKKKLITPEMKNADIELFPHPFSDKKPTDKVILVAPDDIIMQSLKDFGESEEGVLNLFSSDKIRIADSVSIPGSPIGVEMGRARWKKKA